MSVAQISNILPSGKVDEDSMPEMEFKHVPESAYVKEGDVLFGARGTSNRAGVFLRQNGRAIASGQLLVITLTTSSICPSYLAWYVNQSAAQKHFKNRRRGSHVQMISKEALGDLSVHIPPLLIQKKIVEFSAMIRDEQELLSRLAEIRLDFLERLCLDAARNHDRGGSNDA